MAVALYRSGPASIQRIRELFFSALVLAFGVVGWSHLYHAVVLGYADTAAGHAAHVLRDGLLAVPVALAALAGGLWLTRRRPLIAQAAGVVAVLGCCWCRRPACTTRSTLAWQPPASTTTSTPRWLLPASLTRPGGC